MLKVHMNVIGGYNQRLTLTQLIASSVRLISLTEKLCISRVEAGDVGYREGRTSYELCRA